MAIPKTAPLVFLLLATTLALATAIPSDGSRAGPSSPSGAVPPAALRPRKSAAVVSRVENAHGVLGCLAFALFFPLGGILLRLLPGRAAFLLHAAVQVFALALGIATLGMGVWMAKGTPYMDTYHAVIGIVAISGVCIQPLTGILHHRLFKKTNGRTGVSYVHIFWGIAFVTLGTINGGFGLDLAHAKTRYMVVYGIFAALIWVFWMAVSAFAQLSRRTKSRTVENVSAREESDQRGLKSTEENREASS